jgi:hypothetical protein
MNSNLDKFIKINGQFTPMDLFVKNNNELQNFNGRNQKDYASIIPCSFGGLSAISIEFHQSGYHPCKMKRHLLINPCNIG